MVVDVRLPTVVLILFLPTVVVTVSQLGVVVLVGVPVALVLEFVQRAGHPADVVVGDVVVVVRVRHRGVGMGAGFALALGRLGDLLVCHR